MEVLCPKLGMQCRVWPDGGGGREGSGWAVSVGMLRDSEEGLCLVSDWCLPLLPAPPRLCWS